MANSLVNQSFYQAASPYLITPQSLTFCLAYIHYYTPKRLSGRRLLAPSDLRHLAAWIGRPGPELRALRQHPLLAAHLALLHAAGLLHMAEHALSVSPDARLWLIQEPADQLAALIHLLDTPAWETAISQAPWCDILTIDYIAYLQQTLQHQAQHLPSTSDEPAQWLDDIHEPHPGWRLKLSAALPTWLIFDLLQLGQLHLPPAVLTISPLSIARFPTYTHGFHHLRWLLEMATHIPLPSAKRQQLQQWLARAHAYQIHGPLLSASQPHYLQAVLASKRLRPYIYQQLTPRHALIHPEFVPRLRQWLHKQGFPLNQPPDMPPVEPDDLAADEASYWLGLRLLHGLQRHLRLPFLPPTEALFRLQQKLSPATIAQLERYATQAIRDLDEVILGRDAFFPAYQSPTPALITTVEQAIYHQQPLTIHYQANSQPETRRHVIEPHWLEQCAGLYYLHAYSRRAAANLTFRLDRVTLLEPAAA